MHWPLAVVLTAVLSVPQVSRNLVCTPVCLPQSALRLMGYPEGRRNKISSSAAVRQS